jgi:hypothetical protein
MFQEGLETVRIGLELDPESSDLKEIEGHLNEEIYHDKVIPKEHPERVKIDKLIQAMR